MYSIKKTGFACPADVPLEDFDYITTHEPPAWVDSGYYVNVFSKIFGIEAVKILRATHKTPQNSDRSYVGPGSVYNISMPSEGGIPEVGEPAWVARLEAKLDQLLAK